MRNVIFILVDALGADFIGKTDFRNSTTPFFDKLKGRAIFTENMYSLAPYTEAALVATLGGEMTLDHGEYVKAINNCEVVLAEEYKNHGYFTISSFTPYLYSPSLIRGVDEYGYTRCSVLSSMVRFRLTGMKEKYLSKGFSKYDYQKCEDVIKAEMLTLKRFMEDLQESNQRVTMLVDKLDDFNYQNTLNLINKELKMINEDSVSYIDEVFCNWENHSLFKIPNENIKNKCTIQTREYVETKYMQFIELAQKRHRRFQRRNNTIDFKYLFNLCRTEKEKKRFLMRTLREYYKGYTSSEMEERVCASSYGKYKTVVSAKTQFDFFGKKIRKLDADGKNYYTYIHLEDFHIPSMYFSYDSDDIALIDREFENIKNYVDNLPSNYAGNLITDLSALYVDSKLSEFVDEMQSELKNDVIFVITADHGYSYYNRPRRPIEVNNFYQENFRIPFYLFGNSIENKRIEGMFSSMDVPSTVRYYSNIYGENPFKGKVIGVDKSRDVVLNEWLGPGCPDIQTNDIWYAAFDGRYKVSVKVKLNEYVLSSNIVSIFDIHKDGLEKNNLLLSMKSNQTVISLLNIIKLRHEEIQRIEKYKKSNSEIQ